MLKKITLFIFFSAVAFLSYGQDTIVKYDNYKIPVKIIEITETDVAFKKFIFLDGPTYRIQVSKIRKIIYENKTVEDFSKKQHTLYTRKIKEQERKLNTKTSFWTNNRKGIHITPYYSVGFGGLFLNDDKIIIDNKEIATTKTREGSSELGFSLNVFFNNHIGFKTGLSLFSFHYFESISPNIWIDQKVLKQSSSQCHVKTWGIPVQLSFTTKSKAAFFLDLGILLANPYSATAEITNTYDEDIETSELDFEDDLNNIIVHQTLQAGILFELSPSFNLSVACNQLYSITGYTDDDNYKASYIGVRVGLSVKLE